MTGMSLRAQWIGVGALAVVAAVLVFFAVRTVTSEDGPQAASLPGAEDCSILPRSSPWRQAVDKLPVLSNSDQIVGSIGSDAETHPDFGAAELAGAPVGIPYVAVAGDATRVPVTFDVADESDPGPYPIPPTAPIEGGPRGDGDRHVIAVDRDNCKLYEMFSATPQGGGWKAESGAIWDLNTNKPRKRGITSADAAGLPILPGLARPDEVNKGKIDHALRITVPTSRQAFIYPASHFASEDKDPNQPAMGQRLRIKKSFDTSGLAPQARVIAQALKTYGAIVADNGSPWFISGVPSKAWKDDDLNSLKKVPGSAWEVVDTRGLTKPSE